MKRIIVLCIACIMLMSAVASAEITKDKNEKGLYVCSTIEKKDRGFKVQFEKYVVGEETFYRINAYVQSRFSEFLLKDSPISLSIDKYPSFYLEHYQYGVTKGYDKFYSAIKNTEVPLEVVNKIKSGVKVSLWCDGKSLNSFFLLPNDFLNEWKQVIEMKE